MQNRTITRMVGVFGASALIALGMATAIPHMRAAQDPAQQGPGAGRMGGRGPGGPGMGRGGRGGPGGPMGFGVDPRDLTDAQREQIKAIHDRHAEEMKPLMDRVGNARDTLANAVITGIGDIRGLALEVGTAEGELAFQNAQIETEVLGVLTPEQKQKMQDRRKQMEERRQSRGRGAGNAK
jgi:Spy/CpxP family protein refolding chaperone